MSGTINGSQSGTRPYLRIIWDDLSQDIGSNRTKVRLRLYLVHPYSVYYSATKSGKLQGSNFSSTTNVSGTGTTLLQTREIWVYHNSDGTKTQNFNASFNIAITYGGSWLSSLSVSGNATLPTIPRASSLNSMSIAHSQQESTGNRVDINVTRHSSSFRHTFTLYVEGHWIADWADVNISGSGSLSLDATEGNRILNAMRYKVTGKAELRMQTKSGSTNIGSRQTRTASISVNSSVSPTITSFSSVIDGTGFDKSINKYVQGISKPKIYMQASASYGARLSSMRVYRRWSGGSGDTVNGGESEWGSGIVTPALIGSGTLTLTAEVINTRGQKVTKSINITIHPYSAPRITRFDVKRSSSSATVAEVTRYGNHSPLGGDNKLSMTIQRKQGNSGAYSTVDDFSGHTADSFGSVVNVDGNSETSSYTFKITIADDFNNTATSEVTISTSKVLMSFNEDKGIGIGKIHENGTLDVAGEINMAGDFIIRPKNYGDLDKQAIMQIKSRDPNGHAYFEWYGSDDVRKAYVGIGSQMSDDFLVENQNGDISLRSSRVKVNYEEIVSSGSSSNGQWVRLYDGTQICWHHHFRLDYNATWKLTKQWVFPVQFSNNNTTLVATLTGTSKPSASEGSSVHHNGTNSSRSWIDLYVGYSGRSFSSGDYVFASLIVIGRWR